MVVDDDGEVVRGDPVAPAENEIVDDTCVRTLDHVGDRELATLAAQSDRGRPAGVDLRLASGGAQVAAGPRVCTCCGVRRGRCFEYLASGAEALVGQAALAEVADDGVVVGQSLRLPHHRRVPVDPECREIIELALLRSCADPVEIFYSHHEGAIGGARKHPGQQGRPQVSEV